MDDKKPKRAAKGRNAAKPVQSKDSKPIKVFLTALDQADSELIREWRNNYKIWKWCRQTAPISDVEQESWFNQQAADPTIKMFKVMASDEEACVPVGVCGLTSIDWVNRRAEFSLYIAPNYHRKGLGRGALHCLLNQAFVHFGLHVVWGESFDGNPAAIMFESLGFKQEGTRRDFYFREGKFIDAHLYSITEYEWKAKISGK